MSPLIEVESVSKRFGAIQAVDGVSLSVGPGEVLGFLGPNGAGKTTTMRMIAGFVRPFPARSRFAGTTRRPTASPRAKPSATCPRARRSMPT